MSDHPNFPRPADQEQSPEGVPALELSILWQRGQAPDLGSFLARVAPLSARQLADVLCVDQRERWLRGERPAAETYLTLLGPRDEDQEYAVDLLYGEFRLRRELGETPSAEDYAERFPALTCRLRLQVEFHEALYPSPAAVDTQIPDQDTPPGRSAGGAGLPSIPGYSVERLLGRGGMGVVYLATQDRLKRSVALKLLHPADQSPDGNPTRFRAEAEAAARLQLCHIVQIHETGEHEGRPFLVMELVEGDTLAQRLAKGPLALRPAAELLKALAGAVHYAHSRGVVHRDLKPANVLLLTDGNPKLTDFGLAKRLDLADGPTQTGQVLGTPSYMAPEQASGAAVGPAADVYGLGAVLYECLTGRPPFQGPTAIETVLQVLHEEPVPPRRLCPSVPRDLETICLKCLHKKPLSRYPSPAALTEDLQRFLDGRPVAARRTGWVGRAARWASRRPAAAMLAALIVLLVVSLAGRWVWLERQQALRRDQARQAITAALDEAEGLRRELRWAEGLGVVIFAEKHLADADSEELAARLAKAKVDLRKVEEQFHQAQFRAPVAGAPAGGQSLGGKPQDGRETQGRCCLTFNRPQAHRL